MRASTVQQSIEINAGPDKVFAAALSFDAPSIVKKHGALPGVAAVAGQTAAWSAPGQQRTLTLTDGTSVRETLVLLDRSSYDYRVEEFTGPIAALIERATGQFEAAPDGAGSLLSWRYEFVAASPAAAPLLRFMVSALWPGYMRAALKRLKVVIEAQ